MSVDEEQQLEKSKLSASDAVEPRQSDNCEPAESSEKQTSDELVGTLVGGYRIEALMGQGGMGKVYRAEHLILKRKFALKMLRTENMQNKTAVERFRQEAQTTSTLSHPNIAAARGFDQDDNGNPFIALDFVEGQPLSEMIKKQGPIAPDTCIKLLEQVCEALSYAHKQGIVHRDIKPSNIFITKESDGSLKATIVDFGIAKNAQQERLTVTGEVLGTLAYMSPEQALGHPTTNAADIYSLGCTIFEMLTGEPPFREAEILGLIAAQVKTPPPNITKGDCTIFNPLVQRCLAKDPVDRYELVSDITQELARIKAGTTPHGLAPVEKKSWQLLGRRTAAWALDTILLSVTLFALTLVALPGVDIFQVAIFALIDQITPGAIILLTGDGTQATLALATALLNLVYHIALELSPRRATIGKQLMKLQIRSATETEVSRPRLLARIVVRILISWLITASSMLLLVMLTKGVPERSSLMILMFAVAIFGSVAFVQTAGAVILRRRAQMLHDLVTSVRVR
ncbi:MAG: protein kinase [Candidatus Obscuribacterales bacterium]|nr:protein kinase [Candidatus Obscuribacterales bacterium]